MREQENSRTDFMKTFNDILWLKATFGSHRRDNKCVDTSVRSLIGSTGTQINITKLDKIVDHPMIRGWHLVLSEIVLVGIRPRLRSGAQKTRPWRFLQIVLGFEEAIPWVNRTSLLAKLPFSLRRLFYWTDTWLILKMPACVIVNSYFFVAIVY